MTQKLYDMPDFTRLSARIEGDVLSGAFDRGRYATDASIYQIMPRAVVVPKQWDDVEATLAFAREQGITVTPRGGGTSQAGQTINESIVIDFSKHLNSLREYDPETREAIVEPGLVLDSLNQRIKADGLWFPVDVSTASRATIGGMAANNSCGSRSLRYGTMRDNTLSLNAMLADGTLRQFGPVPRDVHDPLDADMLHLGAQEADEIAARFPSVQRRVGGYNIDALTPNGPVNNMAHLLVGSEGTLAITRDIRIKLSPTLTRKTLGVCHFPTFYDAMDAAQHIVPLGPVAVELVDHNMIALGRDIPQFRPIVDEFVRGDPAALLLVEFAEDDPAENRRRLTALGELMGELGFAWNGPRIGGVVEAEDPAFQARIWGVRTQGLNIMMSMRTEGKPVSFVEDCAVALPDLAAFTDRLTGVFRKHGTDGTWYAHASVGLLHVRPVLNLKEDVGAKQLRAIAEEAFDIVAEYKGSHSGEHGDGIVRSEFHEKMFGSRIVRAFEVVKDRFDPLGTLNPGKIVRAPKMDDRTLFRTPPGYTRQTPETVFDWSAWPGGLTGAAEMCNNNGACRKLSGGAMCPSYRATRNERDLTRGRANTLRLALTGQLGPDALTDDAMADTMSLCVSCKACQRECPMSVDMAKMKIEVQAARATKHGHSLRDRLVGHLPRYAPYAARMPWLMNARDTVPGLAALTERATGFSAARKLPKWRGDWARPAISQEADTLLFVDTFTRYFEPENVAAARTVLDAAGIATGEAAGQSRPLCCGRTYLSAGMVEEAKAEMSRAITAFRAAFDAGKEIVGLEPSCVLTFRDEAPRLFPDWTEEMGERVRTFEEFIAAKDAAGNLDLPLGPVTASQALLHGHCHQKAANIMGPVTHTLGLVPGLEVKTIDSSCCGMAGSFGYQRETRDVSEAMAELSLAPAVRAAPEDAIIIADGTSCRHQIADFGRRKAVHVARVLAEAVATATA